MLRTIVDRRLNDRNKNLNNRNKYFKRINQQLKDSVKDVIKNSDINDLLSSKKKKVSIPGKGLDKPTFSHKKGSGSQNIVTTGNDRFNKGEKIARPPSGPGSGTGDSDEGGDSDENGEDEFSFYISKEELLNIFFEDLELPDLIKKNLSDIAEVVLKRAGFSRTGIPPRLNIIRSLKQAKGRKLAYETPLRLELEELEKEFEELEYDILKYVPAGDEDPRLHRLEEIKAEIEEINAKIAAIPYLQDNDLRFHKWKQQPVPVTKAVMFAILDISASMGEWEKEMAKRFFLLLALFLECNYEKMEIRWIVHTTTAKEVTEKEFFYSRENGGTGVSSAIKLTNDIIEKEYPISQWNIFVAQISDGDNATSDTQVLIPLLENELLPKIQYYAYAETRQLAIQHVESELRKHYKLLEEKFKNMKSSIIGDVTHIYPIFRKLFEKKVS